MNLPLTNEKPDYDPLKIYYIVALGTDDERAVTPFQGFSNSWRRLRWALGLLVELPADVLERNYKIEDLIAQRMGGLRSLSWSPLSVGALEEISIDQLGLFVVVFTGEADCAKRVAAWAKSQPYPALHVSTSSLEETCHLDDFDDNQLRRHCQLVLDAHPQLLSDERRRLPQQVSPVGLLP